MAGLRGLRYFKRVAEERGAIMRKFVLSIAACLALLAPIGPLWVAAPVAAAAQPPPVVAGDVEISAYRAKAMLPGQPVGGGYLTIANKGVVPDRLIAVTSPNAGMVEIHEMKTVDDVMTMRPIEGGLEIPAGATVELKPGGAHLMFMMVTEPFKAGGEVPVTLEFENAGKVDITLPVVGLGG
jgi:periplasmic copper chaperone A